MADYNDLRKKCVEFSKNIDGWCESDTDLMINTSIAEIKSALLKVESTDSIDNKSSFQFPSEKETQNHVTSWLSWNPQTIHDIKLIRKIAGVVHKFVVGNKKH